MDATGDVGRYASAAYSPNGELALVAYLDGTNNHLKAASVPCGASAGTTCDVAATSSTTVDTGNLGYSTSISFPSFGEQRAV